MHTLCTLLYIGHDAPSHPVCVLSGARPTVSLPRVRTRPPADRAAALAVVATRDDDGPRRQVRVYVQNDLECCARRAAQWRYRDQDLARDGDIAGDSTARYAWDRETELG